ncbi:MAG: hypothetical protein V4714_06145 [Bacteroidota bacterium]
MKTSNKLIAGLLAIIMIAILGSNMILKAEFDKLNLKDQFFGYSKETAKPFSVVKLRGGHAKLVQIQTGNTFEVKVKAREKEFVKWHTHGDTLELTYSDESEPYQYRIGDALTSEPSVYIMAPTLQAVYANSASCKLTDWKAAHLLLKHESEKSGMLLINSKLDSIDAEIRHKGLLQVGTDNRIAKANVQVKDTSSFKVEKDVFGFLQLQTDSLSIVNLPGVLLRKLEKR